MTLQFSFVIMMPPKYRITEQYVLVKYFVLFFTYNKNMSKFSERLVLSLKNNGMSQSELARKINVTQKAINNYFCGKREPSYDVLIKICKALDESSDYLLGLVD